MRACLEWILCWAGGDQLPGFDFHAPLLSLPRIALTREHTIPSRVPYLFAERRLACHWSDRIGPASNVLRVGVAWAGNPTHRNDRNRSLPAHLMAGLDSLATVRFFSLQAGAAGDAPGLRPAMIPIARDFQDFADTAAAIENLDLVISVDTAVAHLAGALAKPVWTLLPHPADWRWLDARLDTPWYPTMRLFRQPAARQWEPVIASVRQALEDTCAAKR